MGLGVVARVVGDARGSSPATSMRSLLVVIENDAIERSLQLVEAVRRFLVEEALQGLVPALDLATGLGGDRARSA